MKTAPVMKTISATITNVAADALANLRQYAEASRGAYSTNTERALQADVAIFGNWCTDGGRAALPASPDSVAAFIDAMATTKAPATVRRYVSSVSTFHRAAGVVNPCDAQVVKLALRRMHREKGRAQNQATPLNDLMIARMIHATGASVRDMRDRALLAVAYTTLARRAELVVMMLKDLQADAEGFGSIVIPRSKTDQEGEGAVAVITPDAMHHVNVWLDLAKITEGPLFRAVPKGGRVAGPLTEGDIPRIFKRMAAAVVNPEAAARISAHSTRIGAAQDLVRYGMDLAGIMQAARWKSPEMVSRYSRRLLARKNASALIVDRRAPF